MLELESKWQRHGFQRHGNAAGGNDASDKAIRVETREAWNTNAMDAGGVFFFFVARTRMAREVAG